MTLNELKELYFKELENTYPQEEIYAILKKIANHFWKWEPYIFSLDKNKVLSEIEFKKFQTTLEELKQNKPFQYIIEKVEFFGLPFEVSPSVLIPRPETEELVEWVLDTHANSSNFSLLEIGTGSGCIPISLSKNRTEWNISSIDYSSDAIQIAEENQKLNGTSVHFITKDLFEMSSWNELLDCIVSNPPYVSPDEKKDMHNNVLDYEPHQAIFHPDNNPLAFYEAILRFSIKNLAPLGTLFFEFNPLYEEKLLLLLQGYPTYKSYFKTDFSGKKRMLKIMKNYHDC